MSEHDHLQFLDTLFDEVQRHSRILYCFRINEFSKEWNTDFHSHPFIEILYFIKGEAIVAGEKSNRALSANDLIIYPAGFGHKEFIDFSKHQEAICLGIELRKNVGIPEFITLSDLNHRLEWLFVEFHKQYKQKESALTSQLKHLLFQYLLQVGRDGQVNMLPMCSRIKEYIKTHFKEKITHEEFCDLVHVSPSYLNRKFKANTGQTPIEYLNRTRIEEATTLMKKEFLTIESICSEVGIPDPKYFSRVFKKVTGYSPRQFRQIQIQKAG